jgi:hypothetical protein
MCTCSKRRFRDRGRARCRNLRGARIDRVGAHDTAPAVRALDGIISRDND